jgi:hypothetical protein
LTNARNAALLWADLTPMRGRRRGGQMSATATATSVADGRADDVVGDDVRDVAVGLGFAFVQKRGNGSAPLREKQRCPIAVPGRRCRPRRAERR